MAKKYFDYKKELEAASKSMILIHNPEILIKLIARMIVEKVKIKHAGILLYNREKNTYVLTVSRGERGLKIPEGFARVDPDNPLIRFFTAGFHKTIFKDGTLEINKLTKTIRDKKLNQKLSALLKKVSSQMGIFEAVACVPVFFREKLLGILLLGQKEGPKGRFSQDELNFFGALASDVAMAIRNAQLFEDLEEELDKRRGLFINTTQALAAAIDAKDHYTHGHTSRVIDYSLAIAEELKEDAKLDEKFMENLHIASLLHDIGKIGIPEQVLNKNSPLTPEERTVINQHPTIGVSILEPIKELHDCLPGIKYHHEKYDGTGYPEGLKDKQIPVSAAIISVADSFDAITSDRPYRKGLSKDEAIEELRRCSGSQFDPKIIEVAIQVFQNRTKTHLPR